MIAWTGEISQRTTRLGVWYSRCVMPQFATLLPLDENKGGQLVLFVNTYG